MEVGTQLIAVKEMGVVLGGLEIFYFRTYGNEQSNL
jgi:hypothetical protein